jgi:hypothetical protein
MEQQKTVDYQITNFLLTLSNGEQVDLRNIFQEINIYDSMFTPCITGSVLLMDAVGLTNRLRFDGTESLFLEISKTGGQFKFKQAFRVYKLTDRKYINQNTEVLALHFISDEYILSKQLKVNRSFNATTYDQMVSIILKDYLKVENLVGSKTYGLKNIIVPNLAPLDAVLWMTKRSVDKKDSPNFFFFQNKVGYNFVSLSEIINNKEVAAINFDIKNLGTENYNEDTGLQFGHQFLGARDVTVLEQYDFIDNITSGVYASSLIGFDPITRKVKEQLLSFDKIKEQNEQHQKITNTAKLINQDKSTNYSNFQSRKLLYSSGLDRENSKYIRDREKTSYTINDNPDHIFARKAALKNFLTKRVRVVMPGNFNLSSGFNVLLKFQEKQDQAQDKFNRDFSLYGKYTIIGAKHIITYSKHETVFDAVTDSTAYSDIVTPSSKSTSIIEQYGI